MAVCAKCGATLSEGAGFCGSCGTPVSAAGGVPTPAAAPPGPTTYQSNLFALLAYLTMGIAGIVFIVTDEYKNDKFLRFHSFQSVFFMIAVIAFWIVFGILATIITAITLGFGGLIILPLVGLIGLVLFAYWIFLMYKAYNNELYMIPFIGQLAAKQAG
jgi:uncharacterized membrane protein